MSAILNTRLPVRTDYLGKLNKGLVTSQEEYVQHWMRVFDVDNTKQFTRKEVDTIVQYALERPTLFSLRQGAKQNPNGCPLKKDQPIIGADPCPPPRASPTMDFIDALSGTWVGKTTDSLKVKCELTRPTKDNVRNKGSISLQKNYSLLGFIDNQCLQLIEYKQTITDDKDKLVRREVGMFLFDIDYKTVTKHVVTHQGRKHYRTCIYN